MYDINKRKQFKNKSTKLKELVEYLQTLNQEAEIVVDGCNWFYIHQTTNEDVVNIDSSDLEEEYD